MAGSVVRSLTARAPFLRDSTGGAVIRAVAVRRHRKAVGRPQPPRRWHGAAVAAAASLGFCAAAFLEGRVPLLAARRQPRALGRQADSGPAKAVPKWANRPGQLDAADDLYNGTFASAAEDLYAEAVKSTPKREADRGPLPWSLEVAGFTKLQRRSAALARVLVSTEVAGGVRDALMVQASALSDFAKKAAAAAEARSVALHPEEFLSSLSEVFRRVEAMEIHMDNIATQGALGSDGKADAELAREGVGAAANSTARGATPASADAEPSTPYGLAVHDSAAHRSATGNWVVPIQAWIYRRNQKRHRIRMALCRKLLVEMYHGISNIDEAAARRYEERGRLIFRTLVFRGGEKNSVMEVKFDNEEVWRTLPPTASDGRVKAEVTVKAAVVEQGASKDRTSLGFTVRIPAEKAGGVEVTARGTALLTEPAGVLVISDIDDTVKVTEVFMGEDRVVRNTFLEEFKAVNGMAQLYRYWAKEFGAAFAFVSNSPPELQEPLRDFLADSGFPRAPIHLRPLGGSKEERMDFKKWKIEEIMAKFPFRQIILVGDSGERDPVVSASLMRKYPEQVVKILIRQVHPDATVDVGVFDGLPPESWQVFSDPVEASLPDVLKKQSVPDFLQKAVAFGTGVMP